MAKFSPCPSLHCNDGPCRLSAAHVIAAHAEVPPECPNRVRLADPQLQLEPLLNGSELHITPRAGLLLSSRPVAGRPTLIASLVSSNLLVLLAPAAPIEWRNMATPPAVRDEEPDGPPPGPVTEKSWIKIRVVDDASGISIPNVTMLVKLPNGQEREFATRADGMIDVQDIDPGTCDVSCSRDDAELDKALDFVAMGETAANPDQEDGGDASQTAVPSGTRVLEIEEHRVQTGETLESVAQAAGLTWQELARFNWGTIVPQEVNQHLEKDVGSTQRTADGQNVVFNDSDQPGVIFVPNDWSETGLATERTHTVRVRKLSYEPNFIECVRIPGLTFEFDKSFIRPSVVDHMAPVDDALRRHPDAKLIVWGHTDRVGNDQYNKDLSDRRAKSTYAFITDQPDVWEELYNQEKWGLRTVQTVLQDQGHDPGGIDGMMGANTQRAMRSFKGLPEGAPVQNDAAFRRELFLAYMSGKHDVHVADDQFAPPKFMGCGEFNPFVEPNEAELANRAPGNEPNRRVVLYLFRRPPSNVPCQIHSMSPCRTEIDKPGERSDRSPNPAFQCAFYDGIARECRCEHGAAVTAFQVSLLLRSNSGALALRDEEFRLELNDGTVIEGKTNQDGKVFQDNVPDGDHTLVVGDITITVPAMHNGTDGRLTRVPGFKPA